MFLLNRDGCLAYVVRVGVTAAERPKGGRALQQISAIDARHRIVSSSDLLGGLRLRCCLSRLRQGADDAAPRQLDLECIVRVTLGVP